MGPSVFVGVHCDPRPTAPLPLNGIILGTELCMHPPWIFGAHPSTHAFICFMQPRASQGFRVDAQPGGATLTPWQGPAAPHRFETAIWQMHVDSAAADRFRKAALGLVGFGYDWGELVMQPAAAFARAPLHPKRMICTSLTAHVLERTGNGAEHILDAAQDRFPERLARCFVATEGGLLTRVR